MTTYPGRVEALITVPTGGAPVAASNPNGNAAATTVTLPANDYFLTSSGGLPGLCATLQQLLNDNRQGYPETAEAMAAVVGGVWTGGAGWLCNEASGNLVASFGSPTLTAGSTPVYGITGARGGIDKAVSFDSSSDNFTGGDVFDISSTEDFYFFAVCKFTSAPVSGALFYKGAAADTQRWIIYTTGNNEVIVEWLTASGTKTALAAHPVGEWFVLGAVFDRGTNKLRIATKGLTSGTAVTSAETTGFAETINNANNFGIGNGTGFGTTPTTFQCSAFYITKGASAASGQSTNLATAVQNLVAAVNASWTVTPSTTDGRVSIALSSPPAGVPSFSLDWTNTTLRDLLGFSRNINYAASAAEIAADIGFGTWLAGWLCNEASGTLAAAFGSPGLTNAFGTPLYGFLGPRGGPDKAISHTDNAAAFWAGTTSTFDITSTDDFAFAWVGKFETAPVSTRTIINKWDTGGGGKGYAVVVDAASGFRINTRNSGSGTFTGTNFLVGEWHVGITVIDRSTGKMRTGIRGITSGTTQISTEATITATDETNAIQYQVGSGAGLGASPLRIAAMYVARGSGACTGMSANLSTALSNWAATFGAWTGPKQARGIWLTDCPLFVADSNPRLAPVNSDTRTSFSPSGDKTSLVGNWFREHRNVSWSHVPVTQIREQSAAYANASWRQFWDDTQLGRGLSWFSPGSNLLIIDESGQALGSDMLTAGPTRGWALDDPNAVQPRRTDPGGNSLYWRVEFPTLIAKDS